MLSGLHVAGEGSDVQVNLLEATPLDGGVVCEIYISWKCIQVQVHYLGLL